jgi:PAS domain S-box-containing protein
VDLHPGPEKRRALPESHAEVVSVQQAFRENREWYEDLIEHSQYLLWIHDLSGRLLSVNSTPSRLLGYSMDEILHIPLRDLVAPESRADFDAYLKQVASAGEASGFLAVMARSGERRIWEYHNTLEEGAGSTIVRGIARDVTEQKRTENLLRETNEELQKRANESARIIRELRLFRTLVDRSTDSIQVVDPETLRFLDANEKACSQLGYSREELLSLRVSDVAPALTEASRAMIAGELKKSGFMEFESLHRRKDGSIFPVELHITQVHLDRSYSVTIARDLTERKRAHEALRRSEENYRMFVSQSSEGIFREDLDAPVPIDLPEDQLIRHILYDHYMADCNDAMASMYGLTSGKELLGKRLTEMVVPDDPRNIELTREFIRSGFRVIDRESHEVDVFGNPKVFLNSMIGTVENGKLVRTWGIQRDITEKVRLEEARRNAEENLRQNVSQLQQVTEELRQAKEKLSEEKLYLEQTIDTELGFGEIIGRSGALKEVLEKVAKVAPSDATVLLLGETGTGKELVARALHRLSKRHDNSFIKLNCAAIPSGLLESELFGHEKGAFTGAVARKLGRLELADKGTLFLDEIGEIPVALQPKLLRVLQDQEFERLGGTQTLRVNFRLLAATNRDLLQSVRSREFRSDLYYRLNVFPILIPPLRERRQDIRPLVEHFVGKFASHMKKSITSIPAKTMELLVRWDWPGNIRELENFIERSVILTPGSVLQAPLSELQADSVNGDGTGANKDHLSSKERERLLRVLEECHGKLGGPDGAAARLGLKRTTLQSKLDHLGIKLAAFRK